MKDTFTSMLLKIMAVILSILSFFGSLSMAYSDFELLLESDVGILVWLTSMIIIPMLIFCILNGFAEHLKCINHIAEKMDKFDTCLDAYINTLKEAAKEKAEDEVEFEVYGDLNKMSL